MSVTRRQLFVTGAGIIGGYTLLSVPAEASIGTFFHKMLATLAKNFPPVAFARYLQHHIWGQAPDAGPALNPLYANLGGNGYSFNQNAQTTGAAHPSLIASSAFHVCTSADNTPQNPLAFKNPGSATFMNAVGDRAHVTNISGLNYSALDKAGQLYTDQKGCDCAAAYMLPTAAADKDGVSTGWDNGFFGTSVTYPSSKGSVNLTQEPARAFTKLADGSRQYDVAHIVRLYDDAGREIWRTNRDQALNYRQTFPA